MKRCPACARPSWEFLLSLLLGAVLLVLAMGYVVGPAFPYADWATTLVRVERLERQQQFLLDLEGRRHPVTQERQKRSRWHRR